MKFEVTEIKGSNFAKENSIRNQKMIERFRTKVLEEVLAEINDKQQQAFAEIASKICAKMFNEYLQECVNRENTL